MKYKIVKRKTDLKKTHNSYISILVIKSHIDKLQKKRSKNSLLKHFSTNVLIEILKVPRDCILRSCKDSSFHKSDAAALKARFPQSFWDLTLGWL